MKRTLFALALVAGAMVVSSGRAYAHHSFAATYFEDKTQKIEGNLVQFLYRNPTPSSMWKRRTKRARCSAGRLSGAQAASWAVRASPARP